MVGVPDMMGPATQFATANKDLGVGTALDMTAKMPEHIVRGDPFIAQNPAQGLPGHNIAGMNPANNLMNQWQGLVQGQPVRQQPPLMPGSGGGVSMSFAPPPTDYGGKSQGLPGAAQQAMFGPLAANRMG